MRWIRDVLAAAAFTVLSAASAQAVEGKKVDCADLDLHLKAQDFEVTCKDFSDPSALSNSGGTRVELLTAISESQGQFFAVWDYRALGSIYLMRHGFEEDVRSFFPDENVTEWKPTEPVAGFEFAQYVSRSASSEEECIAFRRQMTRRNAGGGNSGFGRIVIGFGCTTRDRAALIESLKQLEAPGS